jgi:hypothetical protein
MHNSPDCSNYQIPKQQAIEVYPKVSQRRPVDKKKFNFLIGSSSNRISAGKYIH